MSRITGELDLSGVATENYDAKLGLRVAVFRSGKLLGSTDLNAPATPRERVSFAVDFEPVVVVGARRPCPVTIVIGPQLAPSELLAIDTVRHVVNFAASKKAEPAGAATSTARGRTRSAEEATEVVNIGSVAVNPNIYLCWIYCCQTHTIRGRLVCREWSLNPQTQQWSFCDNPVPGATVSIYDVHCFFWWCWRNLIGTATTDLNGNFVFTFRWCCFRWLPWLDPAWVVDQSLYAQISRLLADAHLPLPPEPPGPGPDPAIFQSIVAGAAKPTRLAMRRGAGPGAPASASPNSLSREALLSVLPASAELEALRVWPWWPWYDCGPNIVFGATQVCRDRLETVYSETNAQARWDIGANTSVTLVASDSACCRPVCHEPPCPDCLAFSWVCDVPIGQISTDKGPPDLRGYAYTALPSPGDWAFTQDLQIRGDLGAGIDYYKVQYSYNGGAWTDLPTPAFEGFPIAYFDPGLLTFVWAPGGFNPVVKSGQTVIVSRDHYAALHSLPTVGGQVDWNDFDTLFHFNTLAPVIADGLYQLRLVGYTADASDNLANERIVNLCGSDAAATMEVFVDNRHSVHPPATPTHPYGSTPACPSPYASDHLCTLEPECYFRQICKNEGQPDEQCFGACDIITLKSTDTLTLHFTVTCPANANDGHLGGYTLQAIYAYSDVLTIGTAASGAPCPELVTTPRGTFEADPPAPGVQIGPSYVQALAQGAPRPLWYGGDYKVTLRGCDFPESCAYDFQLCAWKRTTNGCTFSGCLNLDYNVFDLTLTILLG